MAPRKKTPARKKSRTPKKRAMPKPKRKSKARTAARNAPLSWKVRFLAVGLLLTLVFAVYLLFLDHTVRLKFEGKRWAVPARVYGQALELYAGSPVTPKRLTEELKRLGFNPVKQPRSPASWSRNGDRFLVKTRSFRFWDSQEQSRVLDIRFRGDRIKQMRNSKGQELALVRLEAPVIGSIYPAHNEDRVLVKHGDLPKLLVQALIVMEDRDFYSHHGVNITAIARAMLANIRAGGLVQGGSTLTQQLVKNFYLTRERSLKRKLNEAMMAVMLDAHYDKDQILEAYANEIYLGQDGVRAIHGFGLASQFYFGRSLRELNLPQLALLVAQVRGPSLYDPRRHPKRAKKRRNLILKVMLDHQLISAKSAKRAIKAGLGVKAKRGKVSGRYPAFLDLVRRQLHRDYRAEDLTSEGLRIFSTLDPWAQKKMEQTVTHRLGRLEKAKGLPAGKLQAAAIVVDSASGEVRGLVGGRKAGYAGFNRALDAIRPVGSLIKPVVYLGALMSPDKYTLTTRLKDAPVHLKGADGKPWHPKNYDGKFHGKVPLHEALAHSYNLATVALGMDLGLDTVSDLLESLGIFRPVNKVPSMLLGATSLSPLEVAQIYQSIAAGGFYSPLRAILGVQSSVGEPLQRYPLTVRAAVPSGPVYLLTRNLQEVVRSGTGKGMTQFLPAKYNLAGKTGTTDELRDSWFAGFTGDRVGVVWLGRDDNRPAGLTGSGGALKVWGDMMSQLNPQPLQLLPPSSVVSAWIDPESGFLADEGCSRALKFPFIKGSAPRTRSSCTGGAVSDLKHLFRSFFE